MIVWWVLLFQVALHTSNPYHLPMQLQAIAQDSNLQTNKSINNVLFEITKIYPCTGLIVLATNKDKPAEGSAPASPEPKHPMMEHKHPLSVKMPHKSVKSRGQKLPGDNPKTFLVSALSVSAYRVS